MQNLFIKENDEFVVSISVATDEKGTVYCDLNKEGLKAILNEDKEYEIKDYKATFKKPSFGDTIGLHNSVFTTDGVSVGFNPVMARFKKISLLIKSWNLTGEEKKPTEEEILKLQPIIANLIGIQIDVETGGLLS